VSANGETNDSIALRSVTNDTTARGQPRIHRPLSVAMFQDQLTRNSQNALSWYIGWERYLLVSCLLLGVHLSAAVQQLLDLDDFHSLATTTAAGDGQTTTTVEHVEECGPIHDMAVNMIVVVGQSTRCCTETRARSVAMLAARHRSTRSRLISLLLSSSFPRPPHQVCTSCRSVP
jgi:hypothetical protein